MFSPGLDFVQTVFIPGLDLVQTVFSPGLVLIQFRHSPGPEMSRRPLFVLWLFWGVLAVNGSSKEPFSLQLVGGGGRCQGRLQVQRAGQDWTEVDPWGVPLWFGNRLCAEMDCGSAVNVKRREGPPRAAVRLDPDLCDDTSLITCFSSDLAASPYSLELTCSDSVRFDKGRGLCSGSLQFRGRSSDQSWTGVCDGALDLRGAEVVCRELSCGPPVLQGTPSPLGQMFQCLGHESALIDCPHNLTDIHQENCSTLQLTCAELVRLVGGASRCEGVMEVKHRGEWRRAMAFVYWTLEDAAGVCRDLDCGSAVSTAITQGFTRSNVWAVRDVCVKAATVRSCVIDGDFGSEIGVKVMCSEAVRLQGRSLCSGSLQIRNQSSDQSWTGVCEGALDHRGAEVLCRELGCGPPVLQGALSPLGQMFHCDGNESALMDCSWTTTHPETCPALTLTCSELKLVGGSSRCEGTVEVRYGGEWRPMRVSQATGPWTLEAAAAVCRDLDCGSAVFTEERRGLNSSDVWEVNLFCVKKGAAVRDCVLNYGYDDGATSVVVQCSGGAADGKDPNAQASGGGH